MVQRIKWSTVNFQPRFYFYWCVQSWFTFLSYKMVWYFLWYFDKYCYGLNENDFFNLWHAVNKEQIYEHNHEYASFFVFDMTNRIGTHQDTRHLRSCCTEHAQLDIFTPSCEKLVVKRNHMYKCFYHVSGRGYISRCFYQQ